MLTKSSEPFIWNAAGLLWKVLAQKRQEELDSFQYTEAVRGFLGEQAGENGFVISRPKVLIESKNLATVQRYLKKLLDNYPKDFNVIYLYSIYHLKRNDPGAAIEKINSIMPRRRKKAMIEKYKWLHNALGIAYRMQGKRNEALKHYTKALDIDPLFPAVHFNRGNIALDEGYENTALKHYQIAFTFDTTFSQAYFAYAWLSFKRKDFEEAESACKNAIKSNPSATYCHILLISVYVWQSKLTEALRSLRTIFDLKLELSPSDHDDLKELRRLISGIEIIHGTEDVLDAMHPAVTQDTCKQGGNPVMNLLSSLREAHDRKYSFRDLATANIALSDYKKFEDITDLLKRFNAKVQEERIGKDTGMFSSK